MLERYTFQSLGECHNFQVPQSINTLVGHAKANYTPVLRWRTCAYLDLWGIMLRLSLVTKFSKPWYNLQPHYFHLIARELFIYYLYKEPVKRTVFSFCNTKGTWMPMTVSPILFNHRLNVTVHQVSMSMHRYLIHTSIQLLMCCYLTF